MRRLVVFNNLSLDGYFVDANGDMSWAHKQDPEWSSFVSENASGTAVLVFGRVTYGLMASYWPTPLAMKNSPAVAEGMNNLQKVVFSRTLDKASWKNTKLVRGDLVEEVRKMKKESGPDMVILGSGSIVSQLAQAGLIDEYQVALSPILLGKGRTMFEGVKQNVNLKKTRVFDNGKVMLWYEPAA
jgi:dihydrofolate reductase